MLNRSNFGEDNDDHLKLRQQEIVSEWDNIEYTLQNDEFWLFLRNINENDKYKFSTRIDFIFDLMCEQQSLVEFYNIGTDEHRTFRYFYEYFHTESKNGAEKIKQCDEGQALAVDWHCRHKRPVCTARQNREAVSRGRHPHR